MHHHLKMALAAVGAFISILALLLIGKTASLHLIMAPFGATCVIVFALPDSPLAKPRNIIGGHLIGTLVGLTVLHVCGAHSWSLALAVSLSIYLMLLTRTLHPPAGADSLIVLLTKASWHFLFTPVLSGVLVIIAISYIYRRFLRNKYNPLSTLEKKSRPSSAHAPILQNLPQSDTA